jgi:hypothetical protein
MAGKSNRNSWYKQQVIVILHIVANGDTSFKPVIIFHD